MAKNNPTRRRRLHEQVRLKTGGYLHLPKGMHHYEWSNEDTIIQLSGVGPVGMTYSTRPTIRARPSKPALRPVEVIHSGFTEDTLIATAILGENGCLVHHPEDGPLYEFRAIPEVANFVALTPKWVPGVGR